MRRGFDKRKGVMQSHTGWACVIKHDNLMTQAPHTPVAVSPPRFTD